MKGNNIQEITINSALGGLSQAQYFGTEDAYNSAIGVDLDFPVGTGIRTSGQLIPTVYEKLSGANISGYPLWISNNPKNTNTYVYASDGKFVSYDSNLGTETLVGTPTAGAGNGMAYYNNYVYLMTPTDVSRYGPLNGVPALTNTFYTGLTLTAPTNTTYPTLRGVSIPNHAGFVHQDNALYFCDFVNGQGIINKIKTKKVTAEGDTNDGSGYNVLDLPFGYYPVDIKAYGLDLAILAIQVTSNSVNQGKAAVFFWETTNVDSFYKRVDLVDPIATALFNHAGELYAFSGNGVNGVRCSKFNGDKAFDEEFFLEEGTPPLAGAVDSVGSRISFGGWTTYPENSACVYSYGSKMSNFLKGLHVPVRSTSTGANQIVTSLKYVQQSSSVKPQIVVGWGDDANKGCDKLSSTATYNSIWRSKMINVGKQFIVKEIRIPLGATLATNMTLTAKIYADDLSDSQTLTVINSTNFSGRKVIFRNPEITLGGHNNLMLELKWAGTVQLPVLFPITLKIETVEEEATTNN